MSRNIVLLSDGTGNSAGKLFKTNVWRAYQALDLSGADQLAHYDDGVGTSSFKPLAIIGGAFGWGLKRNLIDLYTFLCRNYREGDQIYGFGFSRGAFTIRVLIKFILAHGLVENYLSDDDLRRKAVRLYREFRKSQKTQFRLEAIARVIRDLGIVLLDRLYRPYEGRKIATRSVEKIRFLGLWDTVDAYGLPIEELKRGIDRYLWPLGLDDPVLDERIDKACHALSIDDQRTTFHPLLWDESETDGFNESNTTDNEVLTQVWFAGAHSNVGGGYPDDGLSFVPLNWMIAEARKKELVFNTLTLDEYQGSTAPYGRIYNSRSAFGAYYRYDPRFLNPPRDRQGSVIPTLKIHETVVWRIAAGTDGYAPFNLPSDFKVVSGGFLPPSPDLVETGCGGSAPRNIHSFESYISTVRPNAIGGGLGSARRDVRNEAVDLSILAQPDKYALELIWDTVW